jgi:hypothetical protein
MEAGEGPDLPDKRLRPARSLRLRLLGAPLALHANMARFLMPVPVLRMPPILGALGKA